ncbi:MAG TPA: MBL fold metallo-hydrolase [Methyloceanibacter sp.]|jgi:L-ascorbate metabolism protein UlaG (beta-lactamase superfamily)|nr:MBL fold metallo-hydrolase [Methyloceanibacter sp.]
MRITWFGHSCFRIDTGKSIILIDPFLTGNPTFEDSGRTVRDVAKGVTYPWARGSRRYRGDLQGDGGAAHRGL